MPYHYTTGRPAIRNEQLATVSRNPVVTFEFYRFRFHFRALDPTHFPAGKSGNAIRGALGKILRDTASPDVYTRLFEPGIALGEAPSGFADWPRPFVLRTAHLDGATLAAGTRFHFDVHVFDLRAPALAYFQEGFSCFAAQGIGPGRGRAELEAVEQLDLEERAQSGAPIRIDFTTEADPEPTGRVTLRFLTPTELKAGGVPAEEPAFSILFARLRDRLSTLRALYGPGPLDIDFRGLADRAAKIRLTRSELTWERAQRKSGRTGQVHPLGGFTGEADYEGDLANFLPWLRAARWVGVGRQTVWGKGDVRVL
jgi:hypothetical protein